MYPRLRMMTLFLVLFAGMFHLASQAYASAPIAEISDFEGEVIIQSDTDVSRLTKAGLALNDGDRIQTEQGECQIVFNDGGIIRLSPFTHTMIQERKEKGGWWIFESKRLVRRVTCFVGKLSFKTGVSRTKNYLQSPTAVCGLRGTEGDFGYDNLNTYLHIYTGEADVVGEVLEGFFEAFGPDTTKGSKVFQALANAYVATEQAKATGKTIDLAKARVQALEVVKEAAAELQKSPDDTIAKEAQVASNVAAANIAAGEANIAVVQLEEAGADPDVIQAAQSAGSQAQAEADSANQLANTIYDEDGALNPDNLDQAITDTETAATNARTAAEGATSIRDQVVPPEEVPPEEVLPEEAPPEEVPPEEVPLEEAPLEEVPPEYLDPQTSEQEHYWEVSPSQ